MDIYELNEALPNTMVTMAMKHLSEVVPSVLNYKLLALNDCNLFTKSEDVKEISKEERDKFISELKDEFIRRFGGY